MPANPKYVDGWFGSERELSVIPTPAFPFKDNPNTPDLYTREYERAYQVYPKLFLPRLAASTAWTNLLFPSEDFTDAAWTKPEVTPSLAAGTAPDGNPTLNKILEKATTAVHGVSKSVTVGAVATETYLFAKGGLGRDWVKLVFTDSASTVFSAFFNVTSGYVGAKTANVTAEAVPLGNGDVMCIIRFTPAAGSGTWAFQISTDGATTSYLGDVTKGIYAWGAMLAAGSRVPYISTTTGSRSILAPDRDPIDPFAFLVQEDDPTLLNSETAIAKRVFCRIPLTQDSITTMAITKPAVPNQSLGNVAFLEQGALPTGFDGPYSIGLGAYYAGYLLSPANNFYGPLKTGTPLTVTPVSSGQFRVVYKGSTTGNINYNETNANVAAAINALTSVGADGLIVSCNNQFSSGGALTITITTGSTVSRFYIDANSFPAASNVLFTTIYDSVTQVIGVGQRTTITGHGFSATSELICALGTVAAASTFPVLVKPQPPSLSSGWWAVVDANTIAVCQTVNPSSILFGTFLRSYTPGPDRVQVKLVDTFYLPGVTVGIATPSAIPTPAPLINDTDFLAAVLANTSGFINYDSDPLQQYKGRMYVQRQKQVDFADV